MSESCLTKCPYAKVIKEAELENELLADESSFPNDDIVQAKCDLLSIADDCMGPAGLFNSRCDNPFKSDERIVRLGKFSRLVRRGLP